MHPKDRIWITWHYSARSRNLAKYLDLPIFEIFIVKNAFLRHFLSSLWTVWILIKKRPKIIFLQLSFLLLLICAIYKIIKSGNVKIVADCHTKALRKKAKGLINKIFWPLKRFSFSKVNLSIVSNAGMIKDIEEIHKDYILLPDKIPEINSAKDVDKTKSYCVYVSSFAVDEPVDEIFEVANLLQNNLDLYWTGKVDEAKVRNKSIPDNLNLTGYLNFVDYYNLIGNADCILALTTEKDCLQSGAYEDLGVEIPMVISDSIALRDYFQNSALYTNHEPEDIADKILYAIENQKKLIQEEIKLKELRNDEFKTLIKKLQNY
jgi:hypothetical protein